METWLVGILVALLVSSAVIWVTVRPAADTHDEDGSADEVSLGRPPSWTWLATVMTIGSLAAGVQYVMTEPDAGQAAGFAVLALLGAAIGASVFIPARRKIVFSKEGVRVVGRSRIFMSWQDLDSVEVPEGSPLGI